MNLGGYTARGPREVNEDSFYLFEFPTDTKLTGGINSFILVSDGMGGYQGGDVASGLTVACAKSYMEQLLEMTRSNWVNLDVHAALAEIACNAHEAIVAHAREHGTPQMGATYVAAFVGPTHAWIGHIGDSRAYLIRDGVAKQLTEDHSQVGRLLSRGVITEEEAQNHPDRNRIERALGFSDGSPDANEVDLEPGDALLLCSDGVYTVLDVSTLGSCVSEASDAQNAAERVVNLALKRGSDDNSTAVVLSEGSSEPSKTQARMLPATASRKRSTEHNERTGGSASSAHKTGRGLSWATIAPILVMGVMTALMVVLFINSGTSTGGAQGSSSEGESGGAPLSSVDDGISESHGQGQEEHVGTTPSETGSSVEMEPEDTVTDGSSTTSATTYETVITSQETTVKYLDADGLAQSFGQDPLYMTETLQIEPGVSVEASREASSYGRLERSYQMLTDSYVQDLWRDLSRYQEGVTSFDTSFSRLFDASEYLEFVAELSEYDRSTVEAMVSHLIVDAPIASSTSTTYGSVDSQQVHTDTNASPYPSENESMAYGQ